MDKNKSIDTNKKASKLIDEARACTGLCASLANKDEGGSRKLIVGLQLMIKQINDKFNNPVGHKAIRGWNKFFSKFIEDTQTCKDEFTEEYEDSEDSEDEDTSNESKFIALVCGIAEGEIDFRYNDDDNIFVLPSVFPTDLPKVPDWVNRIPKLLIKASTQTDNSRRDLLDLVDEMTLFDLNLKNEANEGYLRLGQSLLLDCIVLSTAIFVCTSWKYTNKNNLSVLKGMESLCKSIPNANLYMNLMRHASLIHDTDFKDGRLSLYIAILNTSIDLWVQVVKTGLVYVIRGEETELRKTILLRAMRLTKECRLQVHTILRKSAHDAIFPIQSLIYPINVSLSQLEIPNFDNEGFGDAIFQHYNPEIRIGSRKNAQAHVHKDASIFIYPEERLNPESIKVINTKVMKAVEEKYPTIALYTASKVASEIERRSMGKPLEIISGLASRIMIGCCVKAKQKEDYDVVTVYESCKDGKCTFDVNINHIKSKAFWDIVTTRPISGNISWVEFSIGRIKLCDKFDENMKQLVSDRMQLDKTNQKCTEIAIKNDYSWVQLSVFLSKLSEKDKLLNQVLGFSCKCTNKDKPVYGIKARIGESIPNCDGLYIISASNNGLAHLISGIIASRENTPVYHRAYDECLKCACRRAIVLGMNLVVS